MLGECEYIFENSFWPPSEHEMGQRVFISVPTSRALELHIGSFMTFGNELGNKYFWPKWKLLDEVRNFPF